MTSADKHGAKDRWRFYLSLGIALIVVAILVVVTALARLGLSQALVALLYIFVLGALITLAMVYSIPLGGGHVSLMPMTVAAAYLMGGKLVAAWAVCLGMLGHAAVRFWRGHYRPEAREPSGPALLEATAINITMHCLGILSAAAVFELLGGSIPLMDVDLRIVGLLVLAGLAYMGLNHLLVVGYLLLRSGEALESYQASFFRLLLYDAGPIIFAPLIAVIYTRLGVGYFALFALALSVASYISHTLAITSLRLERRVQELSSLQAVGQALSASLDVEAVVSAIYEQAARLMPVPHFYVALYNVDLDEVSFPIVMDDGRRVFVEARPARRGLTEYVLRTKAPLLIPEDVTQQVASLGLERIGRDAACWLGIPILAGEEPLGMIAVQSFDMAHVYDASHVAILQVIAAQAAVAIQNARLYERTDEALARRVQELGSVLRTSREGVLLLDLAWRVLAANRALADFVGVAQVDLPRHPIDALRSTGESLISLIRYSVEALEADCERLRSGAVEQVQDVVVLKPTDVHVERTLTPVRDRDGTISGWLLVFRDMTEELELERLRVDLTDMLVHDLRSPMSLVLASLSMLEETYAERDDDQVERLIGIARRSSDRILSLIDDLLDIGRLERGQLPLTLEVVAIDELLAELHTRYLPIASASQVQLQVDCPPDCPQLRIDHSLVSRVLANLVDNGLKFTPDGGAVMVWVRLDSQRLPDQVLIGVQDTGPGIPDEAHPQLFEKFQQVPHIRGRRRGTGLGLPFCRLVVEAHGGRIWVDSQVGVGSTFLLTLPVDDGRS